MIHKEHRKRIKALHIAEMHERERLKDALALQRKIDMSMKREDTLILNYSDLTNEEAIDMMRHEETEDLADRSNAGKPKYSILPLDCLEDCVRVLEMGAVKYSRNNWRKGLKQTEVIDSLLRHITAYVSGEVNDPESGLPHIGHIQANAIFLAGKNNIDDLEV